MSIEDAINESTGINSINANGDDDPITYIQIDFIDQLLFQSIISEERKQDIEKRIRLMSYNEADLLINELKDKQVDPINSLGYNQTQIKEKLAKEI